MEFSREKGICYQGTCIPTLYLAAGGAVVLLLILTR